MINIFFLGWYKLFYVHMMLDFKCISRYRCKGNWLFCILRTWPTNIKKKKLKKNGKKKVISNWSLISFKLHVWNSDIMQIRQRKAWRNSWQLFFRLFYKKIWLDFGLKNSENLKQFCLVKITFLKAAFTTLTQTKQRQRSSVGSNVKQKSAFVCVPTGNECQ